jgi:hypothetical protein
MFDINPAGPGSANLPDPNINRPYYAPIGSDIPGKFPFSTIDEARSNLGSIYNSLQTTLRVQNWHSLSSQLAYTWGHALDYETGLLPYVPQDPSNEKAEYGNSDFDVRNTLTGYLDYSIPKFAGPERLSKGWEVNSGFSFHGGTPFTVLSANNPSGNQEYNDRAVQVIANPFAGVSHAITGGAGSVVQPRRFCRLILPCFRADMRILAHPPRPELQPGLQRSGRFAAEDDADHRTGQRTVQGGCVQYLRSHQPCAGRLPAG